MARTIGNTHGVLDPHEGRKARPAIRLGLLSPAIAAPTNPQTEMTRRPSHVFGLDPHKETRRHRTAVAVSFSFSKKCFFHLLRELSGALGVASVGGLNGRQKRCPWSSSGKEAGGRLHETPES